MPRTHHSSLLGTQKGIVYTSPFDLGLNAQIEATTAGQTFQPPGWLEGHNDATPVNWHVSNVRAAAGGKSIRYANQAAGDYAGSNTNNGYIQTTQFFCPPGFTTYQLRVSVFAATETGTTYDLYNIRVYSAGLGLLTTLSKTVLGNGNTGSVFVAYTNTISASVAGRSDIYLYIDFDTVDNAVNNTEGVYMDEFYLLFS